MTYRIGIIGTGAAPTGTSLPPAPIAEIAAQGNVDLGGDCEVCVIPEETPKTP